MVQSYMPVPSPVLVLLNESFWTLRHISIYVGPHNKYTMQSDHHIHFHSYKAILIYALVIITKTRHDLYTVLSHSSCKQHVISCIPWIRKTLSHTQLVPKCHNLRRQHDTMSRPVETMQSDHHHGHSQPAYTCGRRY